MSKQKQPFEPNRRAFLRTVAFGSGAGMLMGTGIGFAAPVQQSEADPHSEEPREHAIGYHETAHIREYYRKAGF